MDSSSYMFHNESGAFWTGREFICLPACIEKICCTPRDCLELILNDDANQFQLVFKTIMEQNIQNNEFLSTKSNDLEEYTTKSPMEWRSLWKNNGLTKKGTRKWKRELIILIMEIESILNTRPLIYGNFVNYEINFISSSASLIVPPDNDSEFIPYKLSTKKKLINYWSNTPKVLNTFWEIWRNDT